MMENKKISCDLFHIEYTPKGVIIIFSNMSAFSLKTIGKVPISYEFFIDFINSEIAVNNEQEYEQKEDILEAKRYNNGQIRFTLKDSQNKKTYRVNPINRSVWNGTISNEIDMLNKICKN